MELGPWIVAVPVMIAIVGAAIRLTTQLTQQGTQIGVVLIGGIVEFAMIGLVAVAIFGPPLTYNKDRKFRGFATPSKCP